MKDFNKEVVAKKQEDWDKDIPEVSLPRVLALNAKEWWIIIVGVVGAAMNGSIFPVFAVIFGEILTVFSLERDEVLSAIAPWVGLFAALGVVSGVGVFLKVSHTPRMPWKLIAVFYPRLFASPSLVRSSPFDCALASSSLSSARRLGGLMTRGTPLVLSPPGYHMTQDKSRG